MQDPTPPCGMTQRHDLFWTRVGAQHYITPSWHPSKRETGTVVPTWNYVTVQVCGAPRSVDDDDWLREQGVTGEEMATLVVERDAAS